MSNGMSREVSWKSVLQLLLDGVPKDVSELNARSIGAHLDNASISHQALHLMLNMTPQQVVELLSVPLAAPVDLAEIFNQQIEMLIEIKAHEQLDLDEGTYCQQLQEAVEGFTWSEELAGIVELDQVVLIDPRLSGKSLAEASGVICYIDPDACRNYDGITTPDMPYIIQYQPGIKYQAMAPCWCRDNFHDLEQGMTVFEGLHMLLYWREQRVNRLKVCQPNLPGSVHPDGRVPYLFLNDYDRPGLYAHKVDCPSGDFGSASCGSKF